MNYVMSHTLSVTPKIRFYNSTANKFFKVSYKPILRDIYHLSMANYPAETAQEILNFS